MIGPNPMRAGGEVLRVAVWSGRLRIAHWLIGLSCLFLLASGWLVGNSAELSAAALDYHFLAGYLLGAGLALRLYLLLAGGKTDSWRDCLYGGSQWRQARDTLLAYAAGRARPLPHWYGHNPLWGLIYLPWLGLLAITAWTGWLRQAGGGELHAALAQAVAVVVVLHLITVVLHDLRCEHGEVSAMINGHKWFRRRQLDAEAVASPAREVHVSLGGPAGQQRSRD